VYYDIESDIIEDKTVDVTYPTKPADPLFVRVRRDWRIVLFVLMLSTTPLLFAYLFMHLLFFVDNPGQLREFLAALAAAILAVLPLRSVLVPTDVDGVTIVDIWLAIGLVALVCVGFGKYAHEVLQRRRTETPPV
jgi:hypothetical protein